MTYLECLARVRKLLSDESNCIFGVAKATQLAAKGEPYTDNPIKFNIEGAIYFVNRSIRTEEDGGCSKFCEGVYYHLAIAANKMYQCEMNMIPTHIQLMSVFNLAAKNLKAKGYE